MNEKIKFSVANFYALFDTINQESYNTHLYRIEPKCDLNNKNIKKFVGKYNEEYLIKILYKFFTMDSIKNKTNYAIYIANEELKNISYPTYNIFVYEDENYNYDLLQWDLIYYDNKIKSHNTITIYHNEILDEAIHKDNNLKITQKTIKKYDLYPDNNSLDEVKEIKKTKENNNLYFNRGEENE